MAGKKTIRPFGLQVPEAELEDLRERLRRTRLPEPETVARAGADLDWSQGPPRSVVAEWVRYWSEDYDWRRVETELNDRGQALTEIDGLDIHFLHMRSPRADARPMIISHGWPSSVLEPLNVMQELINPSSPDMPAFHVVAPSLPGFAFSGKPESPGWNVERTADAWAQLMQRLGYDRFFAVGGDWGGRVTVALGTRHPDLVGGLHTFTPYVDEPAGGPGDLTEQEERWLADTRRFWRWGAGYSLQQSTKPQTNRLRVGRFPCRTADLDPGQVPQLDRSRWVGGGGRQPRSDPGHRDALLAHRERRLVSTLLLGEQPTAQ